MSLVPPDFDTLASLAEMALEARLQAVRAATSHSGEKGAALEAAAANLIREFLPNEYGLGTGFIAYRDDKSQSVSVSSQLDLIVYDALRSGPQVRLGSCEVYPLEAVYGYIEVKASLSKTVLDACLDQNVALRSAVTRWYRAQPPSDSMRAPLQKRTFPAIRGYVFAFESDRQAVDLRTHYQELTNEKGLSSHLDGVFVAGCGYFRIKELENGSQIDRTVEYVTSGAVAQFAASMLRSLARFPRPLASETPDIAPYYSMPVWS